MNILPKKYSEFKEKQYWNNFFNQLKNTTQQNFQWYGNYFDFKEQLKKIFKHFIHKNNQLQAKSVDSMNEQSLGLDGAKSEKLSIFHIGCGKSTFGQDIQLDYPQFNVINTDYSEQIVKDMIKRSLMMKTMCKYEVCDMFDPLQQKYQHSFNIVLDKGTLDAILPEDSVEQINRIKEVFFRNVELSMNQTTHSAYVIVSMLQPFVLKTVLQHFFKRQCYEIQIQQTKIKDSKMQPFLILIKRYPSAQKIVVQKVALKLLKGNKEITFSSIQQVMKKIQQLQQTVASQQKVKKLFPYQHLTYNISNPQQPQKMRYTIEIIDNKQSKLKQNTCGVVIVPQGKENSFLFSSIKGLKRLIDQTGASRTIVVKLLSGNVFKSIDQVKTQINPLIANFIQEGCDPKNVPFMTDAEQLGVRKTVHQDQSLYIQEIASGQEEAIRRVILKSNLEVVQSQSRLIYGKAEDYPHAKEVQKKTKILPAKKGKYTVIDREYLNEGYCQQIVAGLIKFLKPTQKNGKSNNVLVLGGGGYCIPKFMLENVVPKPMIVAVQKQKSLCSQQSLQLFEVLQYVKSQQLRIINEQGYRYITKGEHKQRYECIIVDICGSQEQELPPGEFVSREFIKRCSELIDEKEGGVVVMNVIRKGFVGRELGEMVGLGVFDLVYVVKRWEDEDEDEGEGEMDEGKKESQKESNEQDCLVVLMIKVAQQIKQRVEKQTKTTTTNSNKSQISFYQQLYGHNNLKKGKGNQQKGPHNQKQLPIGTKIKYQWIEQWEEKIKMIYPVNKSTLKI